MNIIMLGAQGTGKGTVAGLISEQTGLPQISTGDIFRKNISEKTPLGVEADKYISKGNLVPDDVTIDLVKNRLKESDAKEGVILDGFPRTVRQAEELDKILQNNQSEVDIVINLVTPEEEIVERIENRRVCPECKAVYNLKLNPPSQEGICDKCGHELVQRKDDNVDTIKSRIKTYIDVTSPLIEYYEKKEKLYTAEVSERINRLGSDVAKDVIELLKK